MSSKQWLVLAVGALGLFVLMIWFSSQDESKQSHQPGTATEYPRLGGVDPAELSAKEEVRRLVGLVGQLKDDYGNKIKKLEEREEAVNQLARTTASRAEGLVAKEKQLTERLADVQKTLDRANQESEKTGRENRQYARQLKAAETEIARLKERMAEQEAKQEVALRPETVPEPKRPRAGAGEEPLLPEITFVTQSQKKNEAIPALAATPVVPAATGYITLRTSFKPASGGASPTQFMQATFDPVRNAPEGYQQLRTSLSDSPPATSKNDQTLPVYTIAPNTTVKTRALTALFGKTPKGSNDRVNNPFKFQLVVDHWSLAPNGYRNAPALYGARMGGYVTGNATMSCIRGYVTSFTFLFEDGTIHHVPGSASQPLGELVDSTGTCISGQRIDAIPEYVTNKAVFAALQGLALGLAANETSTITSGVVGTNTTTVDGEVGSYMAGRALGTAADEAGKALEEVFKLGEIIVAVPPGTEVMVNIEQVIPIDYDPAGRRLFHPQDEILNPFHQYNLD